METCINIGMKGLVEGFRNLDFIFLGIKFQACFISITVRWVELFQGNFFGKIKRILINIAVKIFKTIKSVKLLQFQHFKHNKTDITRIHQLI